jgi:hypothetical protein
MLSAKAGRDAAIFHQQYTPRNLLPGWQLQQRRREERRRRSPVT